MNLSITFFLGLRYFFSKSIFFSRHLTNILSIISMSLGIFSIITIISIMNGFEFELRKNILHFIPHIIIKNSDGSMDKSTVNIKNITSKYVSKISKVVFSDVIVQSYSGLSIGSAISMYHENNNLFEPYFSQNNSLKLLKNNSYNAILGERLASILNIKIGDTFKLIVPNFNQSLMFGHIPHNRIFKLVDTFSTNNEVDYYQILVNEQDLSNVLHYPKNHITGLQLWLKDPLNIENYLHNLHLSHVIIKSWKDSQGELLQAAKMEKYMMTLLFSLVLLISIFSLIVSISLLIMDKERDIAIFQTLGLSRRNIMLIFIFQGFLSGIIGIFIGTMLSFCIMKTSMGLKLISKVFSLDFLLPCIIIPSQITLINFSFITCIFLSILYPSWKATVILPSKRLAHE
ncbi:MAG: FtsX-like permease family protein [Buchnera aphidicola (Schlechtendalia peitan)]